MKYDKTVFVFGSNEAGIHGAGAALYAHRHKGAKWFVGVGLQGESYAIPTKDIFIKTLPLRIIEGYVQQFLWDAEETPSVKYHLSKIGCGLAGYSEKDIAPLFTKAPDNVILIDDSGKEVVLASKWFEFMLKEDTK